MKQTELFQPILVTRYTQALPGHRGKTPPMLLQERASLGQRLTTVRRQSPGWACHVGSPRPRGPPALQTPHPGRSRTQASPADLARCLSVFMDLFQTSSWLPYPCFLTKTGPQMHLPFLQGPRNARTFRYLPGELLPKHSPWACPRTLSSTGLGPRNLTGGMDLCRCSSVQPVLGRQAPISPQLSTLWRPSGSPTALHPPLSLSGLAALLETCEQDQ